MGWVPGQRRPASWHTSAVSPWQTGPAACPPCQIEYCTYSLTSFSFLDPRVGKAREVSNPLNYQMPPSLSSFCVNWWVRVT